MTRTMTANLQKSTLTNTRKAPTCSNASMRKSGGEPMSVGYSPTPPAACAWSAHSPSKPTKTGSKPTATAIWTNCASRRKPNDAKPHDQHHDRQFAELDAHNLRYQTKLHKHTIGLVAEFSLEQARSVAREFRRDARMGIDPVKRMREQAKGL